MKLAEVAEELETVRRRPPLSLRVYLCFVIAITAFEFCRLAAIGGLSFTVPYTGWMIAFPYMFSIFFVFTALRGGKLGSTIKAVRNFLVFAILLGVFDLAFFYGDDGHGNPYLQFNQWRPALTIVVPVLWLIVLRSNAVSFYCLSESEPITTHCKETD